MEFLKLKRKFLIKNLVEFIYAGHSCEYLRNGRFYLLLPCEFYTAESAIEQSPG
jgi:hypothetical protein